MVRRITCLGAAQWGRRVYSVNLTSCAARERRTRRRGHCPGPVLGTIRGALAGDAELRCFGYIMRISRPTSVRFGLEGFPGMCRMGVEEEFFNCEMNFFERWPCCSTLTTATYTSCCAAT